MKIFRKSNLAFLVPCFLLLVLLAMALPLSAQSEDSTTLAQWQAELDSGVPVNAKLACKKLFNYWSKKGIPPKAFKAQYDYWQSIASVDSLRKHYIDKTLDLGRYCGNRLGLIDSSEYFVNYALQLLEQTPDSILLGKAYTYKGYFYQKKGYNNLAMQWYLKSLAVGEATGDHGGIGYSYNLIGKIYEQRGLFDKSLEFYSKAIAQAKLAGKKDKALYLCNKGLAYSQLGKEQKALEFLNKALTIGKKNKVPAFLILNTHNALGMTYLRFSKPAKALIHHQKALVIVNGIANNSAIATTQVYIAKCYLLQGNYSKAEDYIKQAFTRAANENNQKLLLSVYEVQHEIFGALKEYKNAWEAQQKHIAIKDTLESIEAKTKMLELEHMYSYEKKEKEITQLENQKRESAEKLYAEKTRRNYLLAFSCFLFAVLSTILYLFYQLKIKNESLLKALAERKILLKEIHHRVKNNLQMISSLLFLQKKKLESPAEEKTIGILNDMRNRIKSMALVHQKLYRENEVGIVDAKVYIDDLLASFFSSLGIGHGSEKIKVEVENLLLDVDTMIPVGLILNELITNAIKHAYAGELSGDLTIVFKKENTHLLLQVKDNGQGIPTDLGRISTDSFGMSLVYSIAEKLDAEVQVENKNGTEVKILIRRFTLY